MCYAKGCRNEKWLCVNFKWRNNLLYEKNIDRAKYMYHLDQILFALGKTLKLNDKGKTIE